MIVAIVCGTPGSGKTYFCEQLKDRLSSLKSEATFCHIFSYDAHEIRKDLWNERTFKDSRFRAQKEVERVIDGLLQLGRHSKSLVLIDDIMYLRSMRKQIFILAKRKSIVMSILWLNAPLDTCLRQNAKRQQNEYVEETTIKRIYDDFQPPSNKIVHDRLFHVIEFIDNRLDIAVELEKAIEYLNTLWLQYDKIVQQQQQEQEQVENDTNLHSATYSAVSNCIHTVDLMYRHISSNIMKSLTERSKRNDSCSRHLSEISLHKYIAKALTEVKSKCIQELKITQEYNVDVEFLENSFQLFKYRFLDAMKLQLTSVPDMSMNVDVDVKDEIVSWLLSVIDSTDLSAFRVF